MTRAIVVREYGGPEKLLWEDVPVGEPGPGELLIRHTAIGVNFHDTYVRSGSYKTLTLPGIPGVEAAGVVEKVGTDVTAFVPGDRIVYVTQSYGAYSEQRVLPASVAFRIPDAISNEAAASLAVKGLTACMLLRHTRRVLPEETILVHAAAGGVGQFLVHWGKHLGARVIATVGSTEKAKIARGCGADEVILYRNENFVERVKSFTHGRGVDVVYDSVGADTFDGSLECLGYFGTLVNFGQSSGPVPPFAISRLAARSNAVVRPIVFHYLRERSARDAMAEETFKMVLAGVLTPRIGLRVPLNEASRAHTALESRSTTGAIILTV
ncbi:MAG: quinone oxidoreductase [Proteobacteria bacterium]|nr:quinone oxidoreductase [Pseudomonadota bacterium]